MRGDREEKGGRARRKWERRGERGRGEGDRGSGGNGGGKGETDS